MFSVKLNQNKNQWVHDMLGRSRIWTCHKNATQEQTSHIVCTLSHKKQWGAFLQAANHTVMYSSKWLYLLWLKAFLKPSQKHFTKFFLHQNLWFFFLLCRLLAVTATSSYVYICSKCWLGKIFLLFQKLSDNVNSKCKMVINSTL